MHAYQPVSSYLCTVSAQCFNLNESDKSASDSILTTDDSMQKLATAQHVTLNSSSLLFIKSLIDNDSTTESITITDDDNPGFKSQSDNAPVNDQWLTIGNYVLKRKDQHDVLGGKELNDQLVSVYLHLLKQKFPHIARLQNTVLQERKDPTIHREDGQMLLQIIHIRGSH